MADKIKWGVLGAATIAVEQVIPAMLKSKYCLVSAIASRSAKKAGAIAREFQISKSYGSYDELLNDSQIQAVYIPLPNHLHVTWAKKALLAGKHVLIEKPIALSSEEAKELLNTAKRHSKLKITEAFMYKFHPQWVKVKQMVDEGLIGKLKNIQSSFSFFDDDPASIVNNQRFGGGSLMDIGCYSVSISRFLFGGEPNSVLANIEYHHEFKIDIMASAILEFDEGSSSFFCATQLVENQHVQLFGTEGSIKFELPFNPPKDRKAKVWLTLDEVTSEIEFETCDQYMLQADAFSLSIIEDSEVPAPLEDALNNMVVIEKIRESNASGRRVNF